MNEDFDAPEAIRKNRERLPFVYAGLLATGEVAVESFALRIKQTKSRTLRSILAACEDGIQQNLTVSRELWLRMDAVFSHDLGLIEKAASSAARTGLPEELKAFNDVLDSNFVATIHLGSGRPCANVMGLYGLLIELLGHRECSAQELAAIDELLGALGDPGKGILTLLKRLRAVATRNIRADRTADDLLCNLEDFQEGMDAWRLVVARTVASGAMAEGSFVEIAESIFKELPSK